MGNPDGRSFMIRCCPGPYEFGAPEKLPGYAPAGGERHVKPGSLMAVCHVNLGHPVSLTFVFFLHLF